MKKYIYLIIVLILIYSVSAFDLGGSPNWLQEANAGLTLAGGQGYLGYCSNQNNIMPLASISYTYCNLPGTGFTPVAADFMNVNESFYAVVYGGQIRFYNSDCAVMASITLNGTVHSNPVVRNLRDTDNPYPEIYFTEEDTFQAWEYDGNTFQRLFKFNFTPYHVANSKFPWLACGNNANFPVCLAAANNADDIWVFNITNGSLRTKLTAELSQNLYNYDPRNGLATVKDATGQYITLICNVREIIAASTQVKCDILKDDGNRINTKTLSASTSGTINGLNYTNGFLVKMGASYIYLTHLMGTKTGTIYSSRAFDDFGTQIYSSVKGTADTLNQTSNWVMGSYVKSSGVNYACHLINISQDNSVYFQCFDSSFSGPIVNFNATGIINISNSLVMADFYSNESYLGLADSSGVYQYNGSDFVRVLETGLLSGDTKLGQSIIVSTSVSGSPVYVYTDSASGFIYSNPTVLDSCGDGICQDTENAFVCPQDCGVQSDLPCINNSDCPTTFPLCVPEVGCIFIANYQGGEYINCDTGADCPLGIDGQIGQCLNSICAYYTCSQSSDCPYDNPICIEGVCVSAVSGGIPAEYLTGNQSINQEISADIQRSIDILSGGSPEVRFIIGILIILGFCVLPFTFGEHSTSPVIVMIFALFGLIIATALNFVPIYVLIITLVTFLAIGIFYKMFLGGGGGG